MRTAVRDESGYTLVGLMVVVAVVNLSLTVAVTSWRTVDRRAREAELLWRGEQIVRAIACHRALASSGALERLEQLVEVGCLRRLAPDPMSRDGEWRVLRRSDLVDGTIARMLGTEAQATGESAAPRTGASFAERLAGTVGGPRTSRGSASSETRIIGVVTSRPGPALRRFRGESDTGRWLFLAEGLPAPGGAPGPGAPPDGRD